MMPSMVGSRISYYTRGPLFVRSVLRLLNTVQGRYLDSRPVVYVLLAFAYILPTVVLARHNLFWDDEFFTLYLSKTPSWSELWRALSTGADQHPPTFYYLTHLIITVAGTSHVTLRLTAVAGFGLFCVCLYEVARRIVGPRWALPAPLIPLTTPAFYYATDARAYGLELGLITFSILMWHLAAGERRKRWTVAALAIGLGSAVACHYYAVLFVVPLAIGEVVKAAKRRSVDVPVCCALLTAMVPLVAFAPLIVMARTYSTHFWAVPHWGAMLQWYPAMVGRMPLILLAVSGILFVFRTPAPDVVDEVAPDVQPAVVVMITFSAMLPVLGVIIAQLITHAFSERYLIAAFPGAVILFLWGVARMLRGYLAGPVMILALCVLLFAQNWRDLHAQQTDILRDVASVASVLRRVPDAPIVISEPTLFHQLSFYARRDLVDRIVYVADPQRAVRYLGHNTVDRGLLDLAPWFPLRVASWREWWSTHGSALVYGGVNDWTWVPFALHEIGPVQLVERDLSRLLFTVTRTNVVAGLHLADDTSDKSMLYSKLPRDRRSLCEIYLPEDICPVVDDPNSGTPIISYADRAIHR